MPFFHNFVYSVAIQCSSSSFFHTWCQKPPHENPRHTMCNGREPCEAGRTPHSQHQRGEGSCQPTQPLRWIWFFFGLPYLPWSNIHLDFFNLKFFNPNMHISIFVYLWQVISSSQYWAALPHFSTFKSYPAGPLLNCLCTLDEPITPGEIIFAVI